MLFDVLCLHAKDFKSMHIRWDVGLLNTPNALDFRNLRKQGGITLKTFLEVFYIHNWRSPLWLFRSLHCCQVNEEHKHSLLETFVGAHFMWYYPTLERNKKNLYCVIQLESSINALCFIILIQTFVYHVFIYYTVWWHLISCGFTCQKQRLTHPQWRNVEPFSQGQETRDS